ncbi:hypothetical protein KCU67_g61, partial [Aureobasidium melanogenum]
MPSRTFDHFVLAQFFLLLVPPRFSPKCAFPSLPMCSLSKTSPATRQTKAVPLRKAGSFAFQVSLNLLWHYVCIETTRRIR